MGHSYQENLAAAARISRVAPLGSLREKIDPKCAALLVVDMQNDFCARGGLVEKAAATFRPCKIWLAIYLD